MTENLASKIAQSSDAEKRPFLVLGRIDSATLMLAILALAFSARLDGGILVTSFGTGTVILAMIFLLMVIVFHGARRARLLRISRQLHRENMQRIGALRKALGSAQ